MVNIRDKIRAIYTLEQLAGNDTVIHRLHPTCKILTTLVFIVTVMSFERHNFGGLVPYIFYPLIVSALSETPHSALLRRVAVALPFCVFIGVSNLFTERGAAFFIGSFYLSGGALSFAVILYRTYLCVSAVLLLVACTRFSDLTNSLRRLHLPAIFIIMFEMVYRYIGVLFDEGVSVYTAYLLRKRGAKGVDIRHAGSFVGSLLLKSFDRAERVYAAMRCRGYALNRCSIIYRKIGVSDMIFFTVVCACTIFFRFWGV